MTAIETASPFSTDLDGTVVGDNDATRRFRDFWQSLPDDRRPVLVFNSGRLVDDQLALLEEVPLPRPDYIIGGVGTMLHAKERSDLESAYTHSLGTGFDPKNCRCNERCSGRDDAGGALPAWPQVQLVPA